ncbi:MAG: hypothetical protein R6U70_06470 [Bacillota bacterium]
MLNRPRILLPTAAALLLLIAFAAWADAGIAYMETQTESQVSTTVASREGVTFHLDPRVILRLETDAGGSLLADKVRGALPRHTGLNPVAPDGSPEDTPVLLIRIGTDGFYTPLLSRTRLLAEWYYASDGDMEGLLGREPMYIGLDREVISRISGETEVVAVAYGFFSRRHHAGRLADELATELWRQLQSGQTH